MLDVNSMEDRIGAEARGIYRLQTYRQSCPTICGILLAAHPKRRTETSKRYQKPTILDGTRRKALLSIQSCQAVSE